MNNSWIKSPSGRRVLEHWADHRPTWLWSSDGRTLVWRNTAARFFEVRPRKGKNAPNNEVTPIRGQVARLIRLGSPNRASLSRMQFLAGDRAVSATCACTPLALPDEQVGLLVVGVDPVDGAKPDAGGKRDALLESILPPGSAYLLIEDGRQVAGSPVALEHYAPVIARGSAIDANGAGRIETDGGPVPFTTFKAGPRDAQLLLFEASAEGDATPEPETDAPAPAPSSEPMLPLGLPPLPEALRSASETTEEVQPASAGGLTSLFDRLMDDSALFSPLTADEDFVPLQPTGADDTSGDADDAGVGATAPAEESPPPSSDVGAEQTKDQPPAAEETPLPLSDGGVRFQVSARQFTPLATTDDAAEALGDVSSPPPAEAEQPVAVIADTVEGTTTETIASGPDSRAEAPVVPLSPSGEIVQPEEPAAPDAESVERVSRYNFDELSRILNDRVGNGEGDAARAVAPSPRAATPALPSATSSGALVMLGGETLVLNRLPLGILVFREQQILFANRAITEMTGYESVEALRTAGLGAIFSAGDESQDAGPVNHLVQRDGTMVPVTARLQSVSWQGKPALMLSASGTEVRTGHEAAVKAFAEHLASARADGFLETARSGIISYVSGDARLILKRQEEQLLGRPISSLLAPTEIVGLKEFFERPARFAETARPAITLKGVDRGIEIMLFAQGQAGLVSGYFGFVRRTENAGMPALSSPQGGGDPALLTRLSRGVRRPLNTVIGFSDLIGSAAFGEIENERYVEYARDIKTAGLEIAALVDELDDFARLRDGRYAARPSEIDLAVLLNSTVMRVRGQANAARVLVRSAISERLPRVRADRASLSQAILNLLASAIDQTPQDGAVVLSAQADDSGGVTINVRDSANNVADLGERFVVFRDGIGRDGQTLTPIRSSVGLALTRALLEVNQSSLNVDPAGGTGTLFSLSIPAEAVVETRQLPAGPTPESTA